MAPVSAEATCIYVVTLKVLGVAGITAERLLCNDVTQSPSAPAPPEQMQAKIVICRNAVPCAESHLSSKLQRSSAKEDVSARIGGKQRFLAIWSDLQTGLGATFEVELPTKTFKPKKSSTTAAVPRIPRKDFELLIFLSDGTISAPIAAANLPVTAGTTEGIRDLPLYNIESDFSDLFENSKKSSSAMAAGVGEKMKALQTTYGIDSLDSVLRIQLTVETKAEVVRRQLQQKEAQNEKEMARKLALSHAKPRNGYFRRHQPTDPEKKRSKRNKEASRKAFVHGEKHLRRKSAKSKGDKQTDGLANSDSAPSPSTPLSMTKKTLTGLISMQQAAHKDEKKEEMQSEAESFLTLDQNSEVASIIEKTTILVEKQRSKKSSSESSSSEDATFEDEGSEDDDDYDDEDSEYSLKMPAPLKKAIKMLDMIQLPGCVAADDFESATFDDSTQANQDDETQTSFHIPGCTVPEGGIRGIKWSYSPTTQFYKRFGCWRNEPTGSLDTQDETSMSVPAAQGNASNVLDGTSKSKNGPIADEQLTAATPKKKGKLQTFTATTSKDPYTEVASLTGPGDGSSIFQDIETYSIIEHVELRIQRDRGEPEVRDKPPRPSISAKQANFRPAVTSRPPTGKRKDPLEVADMTSRVISGVAIASGEKRPEIGQATATSSSDTHHKQSQSPHVVQIYSIVSREEEADLDAKNSPSSHDSHSTPATHRSDDSPNASPAAVQDFPLHPESTEDKSMVGSLLGLFRKPSDSDDVRKQRKTHPQSPGQPGIVQFKEKSDDVDSVGELTLTSHEMRVEGMKALKPGRSSWESPALFSSMFSCGPNKHEYFETGASGRNAVQTATTCDSALSTKSSVTPVLLVTRNASADAAPYDEASVASSVEINDAADAAWAKQKADKGEYQKPKVAT